MQQRDLFKKFNQYLADGNFQRMEDSFSNDSILSKSEYFLNLSKIAEDNGDNWASFALYLKAFVENYFVKYLSLFKNELYSIEGTDFLGQVALMLKTEFSFFVVLIFFLILFVNCQRNRIEIKKSLILSFVSFSVIANFLTNNIKLGLLKPQTTILNSPSKVFPSGEVSGNKEFFLITDSDELFLKMIDSNLKSFWVRKEDAIVF